MKPWLPFPGSLPCPEPGTLLEIRTHYGTPPDFFMRGGSVLMFHPDTWSLLHEEIQSLEGYQDWLAEIKLRARERNRLAWEAP